MVCVEFLTVVRWKSQGGRVGVDLKDSVVNMRRKNETEFKEATDRAIWNLAIKLLLEKYYKSMKALTDQFKSVVFNKARAARDSIRWKLQSDPWKGEQAFEVLSSVEI